MSEGSETPTPAEEHGLTEPTEASDEAEAAEAPTVATATKDPNRYTIYVPFDHSTLSLGQAGPAWIPDRGITAKTDNHFHSFVVGKLDPKDNTILTLGSPATAHSIPAQVGGLTSGTIHGYAMVTSGNAWSDAKFQQVLMSREADVTVRASGEGTVGVQADRGKVLVFGNETVTIGSPHGLKIGAHTALTPQNIGYEAPWLNTWTENLGAKFGSTIATIGEVLTSLISMASTQMDGIKKGNEGKNGWDWGPLTSKPKMLADWALFMSTFVRGAMELGNVEPAGSVGVTADKFVAVTAGIGATMYGQAASAIVSAGQAEVLGGVSALLKGLAFTEIAGGALTALTAVHNIEIAASKGEIEMTAKEEVAISALEKAVIITAKEVAQLTSVDKEVFVHGEKGAYVGAGGGAGFAIEIKPKEIKIGKAGSANEFESPGMDNDCIIEMKDEAVMVKRTDAMLRLKNDGSSLLKGKKVNLHAESQNVQINGEKILIG
jgi:hypothetical protein